MSNKAHTATFNRICQRLGIRTKEGDEFDIRTPDFIVEVETSATIAEAVERLKSQSLPCYIAVTNKEGLPPARKLVSGTSVGIMDPQGNIVVESRQHESAAVPEDN